MKKKISRSRMLPKIITVLCFILGMSSLTACSRGEDVPQTEVSVLKDGTVSMYITESFEESYYDAEELQQSILMEAATYNRKMGSGNVSVEKVSVANQVATVIMKYMNASDYAAFNDSIFFMGNAVQAQKEGYDIDVVLSSVDDEQDTIGEPDMLAMEDYILLITDSEYPVNLFGKAQYVSENVSVSKTGKTITHMEDSEKVMYIMFQ